MLYALQTRSGDGVVGPTFTEYKVVCDNPVQAAAAEAEAVVVDNEKSALFTSDSAHCGSDAAFDELVRERRYVIAGERS